MPLVRHIFLWVEAWDLLGWGGGRRKGSGGKRKEEAEVEMRRQAKGNKTSSICLFVCVWWLDRSRLLEIEERPAEASVLLLIAFFRT